MSPREKRVAKVITVRERQLQDRQRVLAETRSAMEQAEATAETQRAAEKAAHELRARLFDGAVSVGDWQMADSWAQARVAERERAEKLAQEARVESFRAQAHLLRARTELKKVELLASKLQTEERRLVERGEQRLQDALATARVVASRRR